jgi:hypothetical protein
MCFSLEWVGQLLIWLVVICAFIAIVRVLLPRIVGQLGEPATLIMTIVNIVMWAAILIFIIIVLVNLFSCLIGGGGFHTALPHR